MNNVEFKIHLGKFPEELIDVITQSEDAYIIKGIQPYTYTDEKTNLPVTAEKPIDIVGFSLNGINFNCSRISEKKTEYSFAARLDKDDCATYLGSIPLDKIDEDAIRIFVFEVIKAVYTHVSEGKSELALQQLVSILIYNKFPKYIASYHPQPPPSGN